jgi:hypothetical protein
MNIVADGYERYVLSNGERIHKAERLLKIQVYKKYKRELRGTHFLRRQYLRVKRELELQRKLAQLGQDLVRNLY